MGGFKKSSKSYHIVYGHPLRTKDKGMNSYNKVTKKRHFKGLCFHLLALLYDIRINLLKCFVNTFYFYKYSMVLNDINVTKVTKKPYVMQSGQSAKKS